MNSTLYGGWRHLYFIYPCLIFVSIIALEFISKKIGAYSKNEFALLIDFWENDTLNLFQQYKEETDLFFGNEDIYHSSNQIDNVYA